MLLPCDIIRHQKKERTEAITILICIREVPGSNLGLDTDYPDGELFDQFLRRMPGQCLETGHDRFIPYPFHQLWGPPSLLSNGYRGIFLRG
jgi:hypothetical protein